MATHQDKSFHAGHRERLRQKFLDEKLTDYELLEALLGYAIPRRDVRPLARALVAEFGGVAFVLTAPIDRLMSFKGLGPSTAIFLKMIHRTMGLGFQMELGQRPIFHNPQILHNYCLTLLSGKQVEEFHVFYLDVNCRMLADDTHAVGTGNTCAVYVNEVLKRALNLDARHVVLVHNHPRATDAFSREDVDMTIDLERVLAAAQIKVYDHLLVAGNIVKSMRALSLLK